MKLAADIADSFLFAPPAGSSVYSAEDLCRPDTARAVLDPFISQHKGEDPAAVISMWSQWYFARLLPAWTKINLLHGWQLPAAPQSIRFTLAEGGVPERFILAGQGEAIRPDADIFARFQPLVEEHLLPVCLTLSRLSAIKPGMFWNNAAIRIAYGFTLAQELAADIGAASLLLSSKTQPDGTINRLFEPVRYVNDEEGGAKAIRRLCCLRYKISDTVYCPSCPLLQANRRKTRCRG